MSMVRKWFVNCFWLLVTCSSPRIPLCSPRATTMQIRFSLRGMGTPSVLECSFSTYHLPREQFRKGGEMDSHAMLTIASFSIAARVTLDMHNLNNEGGEGNQVSTRMAHIV